MKKIKRFILTTAMTIALGISAFAESGFEFILNVQLGLGIGIPTETEKDNYAPITAKSGVGFDGGVTAQLGYMFQVKEGFGISVLGELGYAHTTLSFSSNRNNFSYSRTYSFDSFQIGLLPKFNIGTFAIGIGGGVKIPISGKNSSKIKMANGGQKVENKLKMKDLKDMYSPAVIGYIKGTFDYSIFFMDNLAFNVGLYLEYDMIKTKASQTTKSEMQNVFDIGVELGLKFGPKA